ncbi:MAG: sugar ABC transporter permease [Chloroflexota bacterium]|nr:sugar ABC transporter permease [Chloroflexota bacterium]
MSLVTAAKPQSSIRSERSDGLGQRIGRLIPFHYWAVLPALVATLAVVVVPLVYSFGLSFWHYVLTDPRNVHFDGLTNYAHALSDPTFRNSMWTTVEYGACTVSVELVLGMAFALVVNSLTVGAGLVRTAMLVPVFMTPAVVAFMWRFMLHPDLGIINYFLSLVGLGHPVWLGDPKLALPSLMAVEVWRNTPFMFLVFLAGMQSLPSELFEAAAVDGASFWQRFRRLTLPLLMPLILVAVIIRGMDALREFDTIFIMTGGGPGNSTETIAISTYRYSFRNYDMGLGSAVSYVIFAIVFLFGIYFVRRMNRTRVD